MPGAFINCIASGVPRKCRSDPAATGLRSAGRVVACQRISIGVAGVSSTASSPRRIWISGLDLDEEVAAASERM